jgi:hypothetical protein
VRISARIALSLSLLAACGGPSSGLRPVAHVASSPEAVRAWADVRRSWDRGEEGRPARVVPLLDDFITHHPSDGLVPLAWASIAALEEERGDHTAAAKALAKIAELPDGTTRDLRDIVAAKRLRLQGDAEGALRLLRPLEGKVVDSYALRLFLEEEARAAVAAQRSTEALAALDAWLSGEGGEDREAVRDTVVRLLATLPNEALEEAYRNFRSKNGDRRSPFGAELRRAIANQLAAIALARGDAELARRLLEGDEATDDDSLRGLAGQAKSLAHVEGRTVGVLLPTGTLASRERAAAALSGLAFALEATGYDGSDAQEEPEKREFSALRAPFRLVSREYDSTKGEATSLETLLDGLAADGVAVVVGGFDGGTAATLARWGHERGIPTVLFTPPEGAPIASDSLSFLVGTPVAAELTALVEALSAHGAAPQPPRPQMPANAPGSVPAVYLGDATGAARNAELAAVEALLVAAPVDCYLPPGPAGTPTFPVATAERQSVRTWFVAGMPACLATLGDDLVRYSRFRTEATRPLVATTLSAGVRTVPLLGKKPIYRILTVAAGRMPISADAPELKSDPELARFVKIAAAPPSYWAALGRDAGMLLRPALLPLPTTDTKEPSEVSVRWKTVATGLARAQAPLWTTDATGFSDRHLPRALRVIGR